MVVPRNNNRAHGYGGERAAVQPRTCTNFCRVTLQAAARSRIRPQKQPIPPVFLLCVFVSVCRILTGFITNLKKERHVHVCSLERIQI